MSDSEPRRIYGWRHTQLSIARFYGGIKINGVEYVIRYDIEGEPLEEVRTVKAVKRKEKDNSIKSQEPML